MTNKTPEINDLLAGINDPGLDISGLKGLNHDTVPEETEQESQPEAKSNASAIEPSVSESMTEEHWNRFMKNLEATDSYPDKDDRLICKIDRELAESLDDCNIGKRSRSDLVNAIVRTFVEGYFNKFAAYRRENKSMFATIKPQEP